jgi:hypothetical protein
MPNNLLRYPVKSEHHAYTLMLSLGVLHGSVIFSHIVALGAPYIRECTEKYQELKILCPGQ